jgi:hypothetical protein
MIIPWYGRRQKGEVLYQLEALGHSLQITGIEVVVVLVIARVGWWPRSEIGDCGEPTMYLPVRAPAVVRDPKSGLGYWGRLEGGGILHWDRGAVGVGKPAAERRRPADRTASIQGRKGLVELGRPDKLSQGAALRVILTLARKLGEGVGCCGFGAFHEDAIPRCHSYGA